MNEVPISEFVDALLADPAVSEQFDRDRLAAALDASAALASVGVFVDRALARQTSWRQRR
jgi:hypothetical protein